MRNSIKKEIALLMLAVMLAMAGAAGAAAFTTTGAAAPTCAGEVTIAANGVVTCAAGGVTLQSSCTGDIVIDSQGVIRCSVTATPPVCTLTTSLFAGQTRLTATCAPEATSYTWSANTGFASTDSGGFITPTITATYTVQGTNAAGTGEIASLTVTAGTTSGAPACTLAASPSTVSAGGTTTLTASCSPAATG